MTRLSLIALAALFVPAPLLAQDRPPQNAMPLSQVVSGLETDLGTDLSHISEVSWDDDGYWEVEYQTRDNREVDIKVDPVSGDILQR